MTYNLLFWDVLSQKFFSWLLLSLGENQTVLSLLQYTSALKHDKIISMQVGLLGFLLQVILSNF